MKKSLTAAALAGLMVLGSINVPVMAAVSFSDINNVPWEGAKTYIQEVADSNIMVGEFNAQGKRVFRPKDNLSYVEGVQLAYSLLKNNDALGSTKSFANKWEQVMEAYGIPAWAYESVSYCLEFDIVKKEELSKFYNGTKANYASREDVSLFFGRALGGIIEVPSADMLSFNDASDISAGAKKYVQLLVNENIIVGDDRNNFNPKNNMNRSELAVVVSKTNKVLADEKAGKKDPVVPTENVMSGVVTNTAAFGSDYIISVLSGSEVKGFMISSSSVVTNAGGAVILAASIKAGDEVQVTYNESSALKVVKTAESAVLLGYISEITLDKVTVQDSTGKESTYTIAPGANVMVNELKSTVQKLTEIYVDTYMNAKLGFDSQGRVNLLDIDSQNSVSYGQIKELSKTGISIKRTTGTKSDGEFSGTVKFYFGGAECDYATVERQFKYEKEVYARIFFDTDLKIYRVNISLTEEDENTVSGTVVAAYDTNEDTKKENTISIIKKDGKRYTYTVTTRTTGDRRLVCELDDKAISLDDLGDEAKIADVSAYITLNDNGRAYKIIATTNNTSYDVTLREFDGGDLIFRTKAYLNDKKLIKDSDGKVVKETYSYGILSGAKYSLNGKTVTQKELRSEMENSGSDYLKAKIVIDKNEKIVEIAAETSNAAVSRTVSATLVKATDFDYENREITVKEGGSLKTYSLSSKSKTYYIVNGVEFGSGEGMSGDPAGESFYSCLRSYENINLSMVVNSSGRVTKITARIPDSYYITGEIKSYAPSAKIMSIETSGGVRYVITDDSDTQCYYNGKKYSNILGIGNYYEQLQEKDSSGQYKYANRKVKVKVYLTDKPSTEKVNVASLICAER